MAWFGDLYRGTWEIFTERSMATAIVRIYTKDGFIIAADGRVRNAVDLSIKTDHMQKIFEFGEFPPSLALSCTGTCQIGAAVRAFDLGSAAKTSIQSVSMKRYTTLYAYCGRLAKSIQAQLRVALEGSKDLPG